MIKFSYLVICFSVIFGTFEAKFRQIDRDKYTQNKLPRPACKDKKPVPCVSVIPTLKPSLKPIGINISNPNLL